MKNAVKRVTGYVWSHKVASTIYSIILIIIIVVVVSKANSTSAQTRYVLGTVTRGTLISSVTGTGQISTQNQVNLQPQGSSQSAETITAVNVKQGDVVKAGDLIAVVDNKSALVSLRQAQASVLGSQASYDKLINGATPQSLNVSKISLQNSLSGLQNGINDAYTQTQNVLHTSLDPLFAFSTTNFPQFAPSYTDSSGNMSYFAVDAIQQININNERAQINDSMSKWASLLNNLTNQDPSAVTNQVEDYIKQVRKLASDMSLALNTININGANNNAAGTNNTISGAKYASTLNQFQSTVSSAANSVNSIYNSVFGNLQSYLSSKASFDLSSAPPRQEDVTSAKAQLDSTKASLMSAQNNYDNSFIRAPFDGVVAQVNVAVGDQANTATVVATLITKDKLAVISLNEVDAANVKVGDKATLTFDALPNLDVTGTVIQVDTLGTVSQGVVSYGAKIALDTQDDSIKSGMSVSASIITNTKTDVLLVPNAAIKSDSLGSYVQELSGISVSATPSTSSQGIISATPPQAVSIQTGDVGDSSTEVTSGLKDGDVIIVRTIAPTSNTSAIAGGNILTGGNRNSGAGAAARIPR